MQTQTRKFLGLVLPLVLVLTVTGNPSRADEDAAPGVVRMDRIGAAELDPTSIGMPPAPIAPAPRVGYDPGSCLGPPPAPCAAQAPCATPCGQPCAKQRRCCLFGCFSKGCDYDECENSCQAPNKRCCLFGCCSRDKDCDQCERGGCCRESGKGCCLFRWRSRDRCAANQCGQCGRGECDNDGCGCCRLLTGGALGPDHGGAAGAYGAGYATAAEMRLAHLRCKMGYFISTGDCGNGLPWAGHYKLVYPLNPDFHDPRDSRVYAAQGYGVPVAVPLAPNVDFTYNYGWGVPSSRLTPVSRHVPGTNPILWPIPPGQRY